MTGYGLRYKLGEYYDKVDPHRRKDRKERMSEDEMRDFEALKIKVEQVDALQQKVNSIPQIVKTQVAEGFQALLPSLLEGLGEWNAGGRVGPPPIPSIVSSNSKTASDELLTPPTNNAAPELNARGRENSSADTAPTSNTSVTCTPAVGGPSTLAELDAIMVT